MGKMINFAYVNEQSNFTAILNHFGFEFSQKGSQIRMHCPFHEDNNPSLSITLEATDKAQANTFHCFGCSAKGSPIDFVSRHTGDNLRAAATLVAEISRSSLAPAKNNSGGSKKPVQARTGPDGKTGGGGL